MDAHISDIVIVVHRYKAWFGLCPVYVTDIKDPVPCIVPRHWIFHPLLHLGRWWQSVIFFVFSLLDDENEPSWSLSGVTLLRKPRITYCRKIKEWKAGTD